MKHVTVLAVLGWFVIVLGFGCGPSKSRQNPDNSRAEDDLIELLETLPRDRWPKDQFDTLRLTQATEWYKKNIAGREARYTLPGPPTEFSSDGKGKYNVVFAGHRGYRPRKEQLFDGQWFVVFGDIQYWLYFVGLSEEEAERLREKKEPEITFKIKAVQIKDGRVIVLPQNVAFTGVGSVKLQES